MRDRGRRHLVHVALVQHLLTQILPGSAEPSGRDDFAEPGDRVLRRIAGRQPIPKRAVQRQPVDHHGTIPPDTGYAARARVPATVVRASRATARSSASEVPARLSTASDWLTAMTNVASSSST